MLLRFASSRMILISYSLLPVRNLLSLLPLKAVRSVCPTVATFRPSEVILSRFTVTEISGFPSSTLSFTSEAPSIDSNCASACFAKAMASSRVVPVIVICSGACSAPIKPTGMVVTFAPTRIFSKSRFSLAAYTFVGSSLSLLSVSSTEISDL